MKSSLLPLLVSISTLITGCGGEDFSAPPPNLAEIRARSKQRSEKAPVVTEKVAASEDAQESNPADTQGNGTAAASVEVVTDSSEQTAEMPTRDQSTVSVAVATSTQAEPLSGDEAAEVDAKPASTSNDSPRNPESAANIEGEIVTVGGKTAAQLKADQKENESVTSAGMSLLDKLKVGNEGKDKPKVPVRGPSAQKVISRTGRFAVAAETWFRLRNQLAKRFYVAVTSDGAKIAASSGERSLGVVSTQAEVNGLDLSWARRERTVAAAVRDRKEITTQAVTGLPGILTSVEVIQHGDVVLVGTADGRLIARSSANLQDWDIYAQDLFAWQDEYRPSTKIAESAVVVVRAINADRLLTIAEDGLCHIWNTDDVVHRPISPLKMTEQQVRSPEAPVLSAVPLHSVEIPKSRVLGLFFSKTGSHGSIVTSDEYVTVFRTEDGSVIDTITAAQLNDTQPVCGVIEEDRMRILIGLADGRILRRALTGGKPVTGTNDDGIEVDYEAVFTPDTHDRSGPITAMEIRADGTLLYFGRLNGLVSQLDLPRKQLQRTNRLHEGPVIEIRSTAAGVFTIDDNRIAKLSDVPNASKPGNAAETFRLPTDVALKETQIIEPDESLKRDKFTIRRNFDSAVTNASTAELNRAGIRSVDPVQTLYEHQLRVASGANRRAEIRTKLVAMKTQTSDIDVSSATAGPVKIAEIPTNFDFQSRPFRRVVMSLSDDGTTLATAQYYRSALVRGPAPDQPVSVWDTASNTRLRMWKSSKGVVGLNLDVADGLVLPAPLSAPLNLFSGAFQKEQQTFLTSQRSHSGRHFATGMTGLPGTASKVVALIGVDSVRMHTGVEAFEGATPAVAWSPDGTSLFVSVRDRIQSRLLELDGQTLEIRAEMATDAMDGQWNVENVDLLRGTLGATCILPSTSGKLLVTYGKYSTSGSACQLRIWKRAGDRWPQDQVVVVDSREPLLEQEMTDTQMVFVNQQDSLIAVIGTRGVGIINTRSGDVDQQLELPNINDRRPVALLTPDGKWLLAGDGEGNVWIWSLRSLKRKPLQFSAQAGPVTGLAISNNSRFLATAGEENRIRVWDVSTFLAGTVTSAKR